MDKQQTALTAAFLMQGLHEADFVRVVQETDGDTLALIESVMQWVPTIDALRAEADALGLDYPGVFEYEVTCPFAKWFGGSIIDDSEEPGDVHAMEILIDLVESFFRVKHDRDVSRRLRARLDAVAARILAPAAANDGA